jgi:hypothetical protein
MHLEFSHEDRILLLIACGLLLLFYVKSLVTCMNLSTEYLYPCVSIGCLAEPP